MTDLKKEEAVLTCLADVPEATKEEMAKHEAGYRRGYQSGYVRALHDIWENATLSHHRVSLKISLRRYQKLEQFGMGELHDWRCAGVTGNERGKMVLPPAVCQKPVPKKPF